MNRLSRGRTSILVFLLCSGLSNYAYSSGQAEQVSTTEYQDRPVLGSSLFQSDSSVLSEEAIGKILSSKFTLPATCKIALLQVRKNERKALQYYGYAYWRTEEYLKNQQSYVDTLIREISASERVLQVVTLPEILTPKDPTIPVIREAAVRLQSDLLLVYSFTSDVYHKVKLFRADQIKAYATCELFLLDVRTGLIPFSAIVTEEVIATKSAEDANLTETMKRAENEAVVHALGTTGGKVKAFLPVVSVTAPDPRSGEIEMSSEGEAPEIVAGSTILE